MHCQLMLEAEAPLKAGLTCSWGCPQPRVPRACDTWSGESRACCTLCSLPSRAGASGGASVCLPQAQLGGAEAPSTPGAHEHPSPTGTGSEQPPCCRRARQPPTIASQLSALSSLPAASGWGWGCGGVSQSVMPIWNPLGTFNPPHPFWCCLSSPPPTHTNVAIQAVNLNKFCPAATSRSDEKAK